MSIQSFIQRLLPKEDKFYSLLEQQAKLAHEATKALSAFADASKSNLEVSQSMQNIEHQGDTLVTSLEEELAKTFVTPIDREDIHRLSVELDDIIDFCNQAARACVLFGIEKPSPAMTRLFSVLIECTSQLNDAIVSLRKHNFEQLFVVKGAVKILEKEADQVYRNEVSTLFRADGSSKIFFSQKEILDKLENAVDRCEDITQFLITLAVKHG